MTNPIAIVLVVLIAGFFVIDQFWLGLDAATFLARKFTDLVEYLAFWR